MKTNMLDGGPNNRQATGLGREHVNLVGALSHIAKETFDRVGRLNVTMRDLRKRVKRQHMLLVLSQAAHRFGIAHADAGGIPVVLAVVVLMRLTPPWPFLAGVGYAFSVQA